MRKFGFYFSELIVTTGIYVLLIVYFTAKDYIFSPYNREISAVILLLFGIGIAMVIYHLRKLYREDQQISLFFDQLENFKIALNQLLQKRYTLSPDMTINTFRKIVDEHFAILYPSLFKERIYKIVNMTLADRKPDQDTLSSLLQQKVEMGGNRIRYIAGILIMIGLLGTFLGLVQAIKYLQHFFTASEGVDLTMLFSDMKQSLGGLDKAFGTSIGGITAYLVLGYLNIVVRTKQSDILNRIEEATLEHIIPSIQKFRIEKKPQDVPSATAEMLRTIPESVSKHLKTALESVIRQTIGGSTEHLQATSAHLQQAAEGIQKGQDIFTQTLNAFENFLTTFQEDKEQLLSIQQTLASGVQAFSDEIAVLKDNQQILTSSLETMKEYMTNSEIRLSSMDDVVQQVHTIWTDNRQVFEKLAETIQNEHNALTQILQHLEEFLQSTKTESLAYFQHAQEGVNALVTENMEVHRELLESHTMLTTLLHDVKTFILDEQKGLNVLSTSLHETFEEARFQYLQLTEQFAELHKRLLENQEQLAQAQEAAVIQHLQRRHNA
jgi:hypothetical protein